MKDKTELKTIHNIGYQQIVGIRVKSAILETNYQTTKPTRTRP